MLFKILTLLRKLESQQLFDCFSLVCPAYHQRQLNAAQILNMFYAARAEKCP